MAVLESMLPSLGLFLCLGMLFISASSANDSDSCMAFNEVIPTTGIMASSDVYEDNKVYTILVPVTYRTSSVVLRALDTNNNSIGIWNRADLACNSSVLYFLKGTHEGPFQASWRSPPSTNITTVEIQAFAVNLQKNGYIFFSETEKTSNDHTVTLHDLHDQANHNPNPDHNPNPNHTPKPKSNLNSSHN